MCLFYSRSHKYKRHMVSKYNGFDLHYYLPTKDKVGCCLFVYLWSFGRGRDFIAILFHSVDMKSKSVSGFFLRFFIRISVTDTSGKVREIYTAFL